MDNDFATGYALGSDSGNNSGNGMWGGDGWWAIILFAMIFGWGRGGFGFGGFGGGMNMQAMMKQAQKMQESMLKAQEEIAQMESTGTAGGGMVTATVTGTSTLKSIEIKPDVVDPDDIDMLQDLVVAAVNEALKAASDKSQSQMSAITGGIGGGLGGLL